MPTDKDFKRLVRSRMQKTGESYTAARAVLLRHPSASISPAAPPDYAALAGISDAALKARTGCAWDKWVRTLDRVEAHRWPHREIARHVREAYKVPSWWSQTVTVGYERIKGLRARGQRRDGGYSVSKSKTVALPVSRLYRAFNDPRARTRWLQDAQFTVRTRIKDRSMRLTWDDGSLVLVNFWPRGQGKSQVQIEQTSLPDRETASRVREFWGERLEALASGTAGKRLLIGDQGSGRRTKAAGRTISR